MFFKYKMSVLSSDLTFGKFGAGFWLLAAGNWRLAVGYWRLGTGDWQLDTGGWLLAVGSWLLAACDLLYLKTIIPIINIKIMIYIN